MAKKIPTMLGIDTYAGDDHPINWSEVLDFGVTFAILQATKGMNTPDTAFADDWRLTGEVGIIRGAYHFLYPDLDGVTQAKHFLDTILAASGSDTLPSDVMLALDLENTRGTTSTHMAACTRHAADYLTLKTGRKPLLYADYSFSNEHSLGDTLSDLPLWLARYTTANPGAPSGWTKATLWQCAAGEGGPGTDVGGPKPLHPTGCPAPVDSNRFMGTQDDLFAALGLAPQQ